jgi:NAD(P)-dependent dehydrogenase (short-subunit alcohol dehydrogenase family)
MDISGKTAIVTGAASGIGLGIATALAEAGANVVTADIRLRPGPGFEDDVEAMTMAGCGGAQPA